MREVEIIEKAVAQLPAQELQEFSAWFEAYSAERFDVAIERDTQTGALDRLAEAAKASFRDGRATEF